MQRRWGASWVVLAVMITALVSASLSGPAHASPRAGATYVALGDSGAATTGIVETELASGRCFRSLVNYPKLVAKQLGVAVDDRTCSSAKIKDMYGSQSPGVQPQLTALGADTRLVTLHIGPNDIGFTSRHIECIVSAEKCVNNRLPWRRTIDSVMPRLERLIADIAARSPRATIILDGWPIYIRDNGCPQALVVGAAANALNDQYRHLNSRLVQIAEKTGAIYVDTQVPGHDACASPTQRWIDPVLGATTWVPFHPTPQGMRATARAIERALDKSDWSTA